MDNVNCLHEPINRTTNGVTIVEMNRKCVISIIGDGNLAFIFVIPFVLSVLPNYT